MINNTGVKKRISKGGNDKFGRVWRNTRLLSCSRRRRTHIRLLFMLFIACSLWLADGVLQAAQAEKLGVAVRETVPSDSRLEKTTVSSKSEEYCIRPGDVLSIAVFQEPDLTQKTKVTRSGSIRYPILGDIELGGMTVSEAEKKIAELLAKDYLVNPRVTISVDTNKTRQSVTLFGEVKSPGIFEIPDQERMTLIQVIGRAGGFTNIAATDRVMIIRTENGKEKSIRVNVSAIIKSGDVSKDIELRPGDLISVPETFF